MFYLLVLFKFLIKNQNPNKLEIHVGSKVNQTRRKPLEQDSFRVLPIFQIPQFGNFGFRGQKFWEKNSSKLSF